MRRKRTLLTYICQWLLTVQAAAGLVMTTGPARSDFPSRSLLAPQSEFQKHKTPEQPSAGYYIPERYQKTIGDSEKQRYGEMFRWFADRFADTQEDYEELKDTIANAAYVTFPLPLNTDVCSNALSAFTKQLFPAQDIKQLPLALKRQLMIGVFKVAQFRAERSLESAFRIFRDKFKAAPDRLDNELKQQLIIAMHNVAVRRGEKGFEKALNIFGKKMRLDLPALSSDIMKQLLIAAYNIAINGGEKVLDDTLETIYAEFGLSNAAMHEEMQKQVIIAAYNVAMTDGLRSMEKAVEIYRKKFRCDVPDLSDRLKRQLLIAVYNVAMTGADKFLGPAIDRFCTTFALKPDELEEGGAQLLIKASYKVAMHRENGAKRLVQAINLFVRKYALKTGTLNDDEKKEMIGALYAIAAYEEMPVDESIQDFNRKYGFRTVLSGLPRYVPQLPADETILAALGRVELFKRAQEDFARAGAAEIDNKAYWERIGPAFEASKLQDDLLHPEQIHHFMELLGDPDKSIFEIGMGSGRAGHLFAESGFENYSGIDISKQNISRARMRLGIADEQRLIAGDFMRFDPAGKKYDGVFASDVLLYLSPEDQVRFLLKAAEMTNDSGILYLRWAPGGNTVTIKTQETRTGTVKGWVFLPSPEYIEMILDAAGFELIEPIREIEQKIYVGTPAEKMQKYLTVYARKKIQAATESVMARLKEDHGVGPAKTEHMQVKASYYSVESVKDGKPVKFATAGEAKVFGEGLVAAGRAVKESVIVEGRIFDIIIDKGSGLTAEAAAAQISEALARTKDIGGDISKLPQTIVFALLDTSSHMFEDHVANGFIGINKALLAITDDKVRNILLQVGIFHELCHEVTGGSGAKFEAAQIVRDARIANELLQRNAVMNDLFEKNVLERIEPSVSVLLREMILIRMELILIEFSKTKDPALLTGLVPLIMKMHEFIAIDSTVRAEFNEVLKNVMDGRVDGSALFDWLRKNTSARLLEIGDVWNTSTKTDTDDGAWGPATGPLVASLIAAGKDPRLNQPLDRVQHVKMMIAAGLELLRGTYTEIKRSVHQRLTGEDRDDVRPSLSPHIFEKTMKECAALSPAMRRLAYLGLVFHDYARILKDKTAVRPSAADDGRHDGRPDANQHRVSGSILAGELLRLVGLSPFDIAVVKLLIRQHDAFWCLYVLGKYGDYNNFTYPENLLRDIHTTVAELKKLEPEISEKETRDNLLRMIAVMTTADVSASGDRYLSDQYLLFVARFIQAVTRAEYDVEDELSLLITDVRESFSDIDQDAALTPAQKGAVKEQIVRQARAAQIGLLKVVLERSADIDGVAAAKQVKDIILSLTARAQNPLVNAVLLEGIAAHIPADGIRGVQVFADMILAEPDSVMSYIYQEIGRAVDAAADNAAKKKIAGMMQEAGVDMRKMKEHLEQIAACELTKRKYLSDYHLAMKGNVDRQLTAYAAAAMNKEEKIGVLFDASAFIPSEFDVQMSMIAKAAARGVEFVITVADGTKRQGDIVARFGGVPGVIILTARADVLPAFAEREVTSRLESGRWKRFGLIIGAQALAAYGWVRPPMLEALLLLDAQGRFSSADIALIRQIGLESLARAIEQDHGRVPPYADTGPCPLNELNDAVRMLETQA